jgi:hypothetical protein
MVKQTSTLIMKKEAIMERAEQSGRDCNITSRTKISRSVSSSLVSFSVLMAFCASSGVEYSTILQSHAWGP